MTPLEAIDHVATVLRELWAGDMVFVGGAVVGLVDGRPELVNEVHGADSEAREFVGNGFRRLLDDARFEESIPAHLMPDPASQSRVPFILERMHGVARRDGPNASDAPHTTRSEGTGEAE